MSIYDALAGVCEITHLRLWPDGAILKQILDGRRNTVKDAVLPYFVILNPSAGRGAGALAREPIERQLRLAGATYDLVETTGAGQPELLAYEAAVEGYEIIVSVGGDGTAHEVVNGMVRAARDRSEPVGEENPVGVLGLVPIGTGNDYAWRLGIPLNNPTAATQLLIEGPHRRVDLGEVTDENGRREIFHNHFGGGFEAAAAIESLKIQRFRGLTLYLAALTRVIPQYAHPVPVTVQYNGTVRSAPMLLVSAANGGRTGGGFKIAPGAQLDDGELDVILGFSPNIPTTLYLLPHFMRGTHIGLTRYVAADRTSDLTIEAPGGLPVHLDGEIFREDARRMTIRVLPRHLEVIAPTTDRKSAQG
jgi:diacylglycerol kinase (ATP)